MVAQPVTTAQSILSHAGEILHRHEEIARRTGRRFNLFDLLDRTTDEVKGHSAFIAELLNPLGAHGQGDLFLQAFWGRLAPLVPPTWRLDETDGGWTVRVEVAFDRSRADIVLDCTTHRIVIENKIYTSERGGQLQRYYRWAKKMGRIAGVIFLPLESGEPSKAAREEIGARLLATDYASLILPWINDCIGLAARVPSVRESLIQYHRLVARLTQEPEDMDSLQEITDLLDKPEKLNAAAELANALVKKRAEIHLQFWKALEEALCERLGLTAADFHGDVRYDSVKVQDFHSRKRNRPRLFGLRFNIPGRNPWAIKVEVNYHIYFGVVVIEKGKQKNPIPREQNKLIKGVLEEAGCPGFSMDDDEPHILWKYGNGMEDIVFCEQGEASSTHILADNTIFNQRVSSMAEDIVRIARALSDGWPKKR